VSPETAAAPPGHLARAQALLRRLPWLLPLVSFVSGWASYALVDRGNEHVARLIAALSLAGWPWLLMQSVLGKWLERRTRGRLSGGLLHFVTQALQLEMLFFSLPFLIGASEPYPGHFIFTGVAVAAAMLCTIDPLYQRHLASSPFLSVLFHAYCTFIGALVMLPLVARLNLELSLPFALCISGGLLLASLPHALSDASLRRRLARLILLAVVPALVWAGRSGIPAAGLRVGDARMTQSLIDPLVPGPGFDRVGAGALHADGAIAFAAVRAPSGLAQSVEFIWTHRGAPVDRIAAVVTGGREEGYRLYSRKQAFPADPRGPWTVDLRAPDGRLIHRWRFEVD
jgi:hypothetical protein